MAQKRIAYFLTLNKNMQCHMHAWIGQPPHAWSNEQGRGQNILKILATVAARSSTIAAAAVRHLQQPLHLDSEALGVSLECQSAIQILLSYGCPRVANWLDVPSACEISSGNTFFETAPEGPSQRGVMRHWTITPSSASWALWLKWVPHESDTGQFELFFCLQGLRHPQAHM